MFVEESSVGVLEANLDASGPMKAEQRSEARGGREDGGLQERKGGKSA